MNNSYIGPNELIYNNDNGIHSGGFNINSIMMKNGLSPIMTLNSNTNGGSFMQQDGGDGNNITKVSDLFNNLVIPNWNLSYNYKHGGSFVERNNKYEHDDIIEDELHDKLLNLVKVHEDEMKELSSNKKKSRKNLKQPKNHTKKYRNKL